jgi:hypothetical protein
MQAAGYRLEDDAWLKIDVGDRERVEIDTRSSEYTRNQKLIELRRLAHELARRKCEAMHLYEPLVNQAAFHLSRTRIRLLRGSNRGGKTLPAAVEVARALTNRDPYKKYPARDGRWFAVGKDLDHCGQVMYRKLFRAGAFRIIRDRATGQWRALRPWLVEDQEREGEARLAPPLIPSRFVQEIAWENKKESIPSLIRLTNGWELSFYSSLGKPPQGSDIDGWWFDEEIVDSEWYPEMSARIIDRHGRGIWSATPQAGTDQLLELHDRADQERGLIKKSVEEFVILLRNNPHIREEDKAEFARDLSDDERAVRVEGEFIALSFKVYPEFAMSLHGVDWFSIPREWTRYMVVDPGHSVCAVLFGAVPPVSEGNFCYLYDELYIRQCHAALFAEQVASRAAGQRFQAFLIDQRMGVQTELGVGITVAQQYANALREKNIKSDATGSHFIYASDDVLQGITSVHGWLRLREDGTTRLRVLRGALPNFEYEMSRYHKMREKGQILDKPNQRKNNHLMDCIRYLAQYDPRYVKWRAGKHPAGPAMSAYRAKQKRKREGAGGASSVNLGPGGMYV